MRDIDGKITFHRDLTKRESVADRWQRARTDGHVIRHRANRSDAASTRTGILTLRSYASLRLRTVGVHETLRLTALIRVASVVRYALANGRVESLMTVRVYTAR